MVMGLINLLKAECLPDSNDESSSTSSASQKRRRPDSVVTVPVKKRTSSSAPTMAEWVAERRDPASGANRRYGESEPSMRGRKPYRGGVARDPGVGVSGEEKGDKASIKTTLQNGKLGFKKKMCGKQTSKLVKKNPANLQSSIQGYFGNSIANSWWDLWAIFWIPTLFFFSFFPIFSTDKLLVHPY
jgi:hypothetical protein